MKQVKYFELPTRVPEEIIERAEKLSPPSSATGWRRLGYRETGVWTPGFCPLTAKSL